MKMNKLILLCLPLLLTACHSIETRIEIDAPPERVWKEFSAFKSYGEWNPFIRTLKTVGVPTKGRAIEVKIAAPGEDPITFRPSITEYRAGRTLEWQGRFLMPGIFTGRHRFELIKLGPERTLFLHTEKFNGILVPFFGFESTRKGFEAMNRELKNRAEK